MRSLAMAPYEGENYWDPGAFAIVYFPLLDVCVAILLRDPVGRYSPSLAKWIPKTESAS